jgi:hypothetical protein
MTLWARRLLAVAVAGTGLWGVAANASVGSSEDDIAFIPAMVAFAAMGILLVLKVPETVVSVTETMRPSTIGVWVR